MSVVYTFQSCSPGLHGAMVSTRYYGTQWELLVQRLVCNKGTPLGPLLFCLVLQKVVSAIAVDSVCSELLFHAWYLDDGVIAGPRLAVEKALSIIQELSPSLGLFVNPTKCELFSRGDLSSFPIEMKRSNVPHLEILGAPIGDLIFCAKIVAQKRASALKLLTQLSEVGSADPQVALLLLRQCGGFCKLVHLSRSAPPSLVADALRLYDDDVRQCFTECTSVDTPNHAWQQAQLSLSRGGLGLRCLSHHSSAAYIASLTAFDSGSSTNHHLLQSIQLYNSLVPVAHHQATKKFCPADLKIINSGCSFNLYLCLIEHDFYLPLLPMLLHGSRLFQLRGSISTLTHQSFKLV